MRKGSPASRRGIALILILSAISLLPYTLFEKEDTSRSAWWKRIKSLVNRTSIRRKTSSGVGLPLGGTPIRLQRSERSSNVVGNRAVNSTYVLEASNPTTQKGKTRSEEGTGSGDGVSESLEGRGNSTYVLEASNPTTEKGETRSEEGTGSGDGVSDSLEGRGRKRRKEGRGDGSAPTMEKKEAIPKQEFPPNPTIPVCNIPDVELVPNAWPHYGRKDIEHLMHVGSGMSGDGQNCSFWAIDRSNATFQMLMRGRMANIMLQYFWRRIKADSNGWGIQNMNNWDKTSILPKWVNRIQHYRHAEIESFVPSAPLAKVDVQGCGPHFQDYLYYKKERCLAQCIFSRRKNANMSHRIFRELGPNDVVIHYREPAELINPVLNRQRLTYEKTMPPFEYYDTILSRLKDRGELGKVWIATAHVDTSMPFDTDSTVSRLQKNIPVKEVLSKYGGEIIRGTSEQDHYIARQAPIFIGSFGTYSWTIAYLSAGREIHLPYDSSHKAGSSWNRWSSLWIDDDPRIFYHDCFGTARFQTAAEVAEMDSPFGATVRRRAKDAGHCNPRLVDPPDLRYWPQPTRAPSRNGVVLHEGRT